MYCVKGGWGRRTFALAAHNDSEGRKTRVRRSKEERKSMVETFIKNYQSLNDGNFPSLNLTHKEVGGSFYTVREIVREIIQENRILGPAKYSSEQQRLDFNSQDHPLAAITSEPQSSLVQESEEAIVVPDFPSRSNWELPTEGSVQLSIGLGLENGQSISGNRSKELDRMVSAEEPRNGGLLEYCHGSDSPVSQGNLFNSADKIVGVSDPQSNNSFELPVNGDMEISFGMNLENGQLVSGEGVEELDKKTVSKVSAESGSSEADGESELTWESTVELTNPMAEVDVETFPVQLVASDGALHHTRDLSRTYDGLRTKHAESVNSLDVMDSLDSDDSAGLENQGAGSEPGVKSSNGNHCMVGGQLVEDLVNESLEVLDQTNDNGSVTRDSMDQPQLDLSTETIQQMQDTLGKELQPKGEVVDGAYVKNLSTTISGITNMESTSKKTILHVSRDDAAVDDDSLKGTSPTLDRINLESWEGASKRSSEPETNPILEFFKAIVTAFVKFWSE